MSARPTHRRDPHAHWAQQYDFVYHTLYGDALAEMTQATLSHIQAHTHPGDHLLDVGAGTGRLAIPLAHLGYQVTAVDPSAAMLTQLQQKAPSSITCLGDLTRHHPTTPYHLALLVFTTISYITTGQALRNLLHQIAGRLQPGGYLIVDQPSRHTFASATLTGENADGYVCRHISMRPVGRTHFHYHEQTRGNQQGAPFAFQTALRMRYWSKHTLATYLASAGFSIVDEALSGHDASGAQYLLCQRT